jgi:hypothetical protein
MEARERRLRMPNPDDIHGQSLNNERGKDKSTLAIGFFYFNVTSDDRGL